LGWVLSLEAPGWTSGNTSKYKKGDARREISPTLENLGKDDAYVQGKK
jgi:hypothetical protein